MMAFFDLLPLRSYTFKDLKKNLYRVSCFKWRKYCGIVMGVACVRILHAKPIVNIANSILQDAYFEIILSDSDRIGSKSCLFGILRIYGFALRRRYYITDLLR